MIFHSLEFVAFFLVVVTVYWQLDHRSQNVLLLVASYMFYGWVHPWFLILIATSTTVDYCAARGMERWPEHKRAFLWLSVTSNFGMLGFFKYFNFFIGNVAAVMTAMGLHAHLPVLRVILPVGHLVLYLSGDELHDRRLPRGAARTSQPARRRRVHLLLPASGRRADSARVLFAAAGGRGADVRVAAAVERRGAHVLGVLQEAGDCRQRRGHRQQGLRVIRSVVRDPLGGCIRVCDSDLRGFLGLHRHRPRRVALAWESS